MFFYGTHETANLKSDEMWPYNPETRAKFATMKNMKKEGYREGLLEIEEKHQNAAVEAMEEVNNVALLGRIEEVMMKEPSESDVVEAGCCAAKDTTGASKVVRFELPDGDTDALEENVDPMEEEKDGTCPTISAVVNCGSTLEGEEVVEESLMGVEASEDARVGDEDPREAPSTSKSQPAGSLLEKAVAKMTKKQCCDPISAKQGVKKMGTNESGKLKKGKKGRKPGNSGNASFMSEGSSSSSEEEEEEVGRKYASKINGI